MYTEKAPSSPRSVLTPPSLGGSLDGAIMGVSLHVLGQARIPAYKKLLLCGIMGSGIFIIVASILRCVYSLQPPYQDMRLAMLWTSREFLVTALACSAPGIRGLCNKQLWQMRRYNQTPRDSQHGIFGWPRGTGLFAARDNEMGGRAAGIGLPRPVSLQGFCTRSTRTSVASSDAPSVLPNKPGGVEEMTCDLTLYDDEERATGLN